MIVKHSPCFPKRIETCSGMGWTIWIAAAAGLTVVVLMLRHISLVPLDGARELLRNGGEIIDVRRESEFRSGHIEGAINIPLGELRSSISRFVPDKTTPLLLHCLSGGRSGIARRLLLSQGYREVHNLGSYRRAAKLHCKPAAC